jgi:hypothetical protein
VAKVDASVDFARWSECDFIFVGGAVWDCVGSSFISVCLGLD